VYRIAVFGAAFNDFRAAALDGEIHFAYHQQDD